MSFCVDVLASCFRIISNAGKHCKSLIWTQRGVLMCECFWGGAPQGVVPLSLIQVAESPRWKNKALSPPGPPSTHRKHCQKANFLLILLVPSPPLLVHCVIYNLMSENGFPFPTSPNDASKKYVILHHQINVSVRSEGGAMRPEICNKCRKVVTAAVSTSQT